jgi:uncharacterized repeat protein (TIGR03803 family)
MKQIANASNKLYTVIALCAATAVTLPAQTFTTLLNFSDTEGQDPSALVRATNGDLYGTAWCGGAAGCDLTDGTGTVFKITPSGTLTTAYSFCSQDYPQCTDGAGPYAALIRATNGDLYGTTYSGGANCAEAQGCGTVFKITPTGTLTTLHSFCAETGCPDGAYPSAGLVQTTNGDLYGTTQGGGAKGAGTVFKITPSGTLTTLYSFCSQGIYPDCTDGEDPSAGLIQATDGDLYGTTGAGLGNGNRGTVFKITPGGTLTTLYTFCAESGCPDGAGPWGLVQAANGDFYGTTNAGGASNDGTVFKITPGGTLTTLHSFCAQSGCTDGIWPRSGLIQATNGDLYGTTFYGGANDNCNTGGPEGCGTVFQITPGGTLTTLYNFCSQLVFGNCTDGEYPSGLVQNTNGTFYGTTSGGGASYDGTVFSLSVGLGPFVETQTTSGPVGAAVKILGSDLTGATSVTFNGAAATFTVVSRYLITTTVPAGATTGTVHVVTPAGTLSSNVPFRVR